MKIQEPVLEKYFAAANGYSGFKSYFPLVFNPRKFDRIYVIKGGPGTGKSTFMKKLAHTLAEHDCSVEKIYCSSDPKSLDGLIGRKGDRQIAILDGTAPHERDAVIPGAFDEIVNLADAWDTRWLIGQKDNISDLNLEKSAAYKTAYYYMSLAGKSRELYKNAILDSNNDKIKNIAIKLAAELIGGAEIGNKGTRLIRGFCRHGIVRFDTVEKISDVCYTLPDSVAGGLILSKLCELICDAQIGIIHFPNPLDTALTDAIYIPSKKIGITLGGTGEAIDISDADVISELMSEKTRIAQNLHDSALHEAQRWFDIASDIHYRLEAIYSKSVDFSKVDAIYDEKSAQILEIIG